MPGVDDTNYKTKASFHPSFRLLWPRPANTSHFANTRWNFSRFYICADTEWWWDIQILFVTRCSGRVSVPRLWSLTDHRGQVMSSSSLRSHHEALLCKPVAIIQEALILRWYSWMLTPPHGWWSGDHQRTNSATWSDIVLSQFQLLRIPSSILHFWLVQMLRKDQTRGVGKRRGLRGPPRRDAESNDPEVRLVRT